MTYCIDRFEGTQAVLIGADGSVRNLPRERLPEQAREGDYLSLAGGRVELLPEARSAAAERIAEKLRRLRGDG